MSWFYHLAAAQLLLGAASACDSGLDWSEKGLATIHQPQPPQQPPMAVDRSSWPAAMKAKAEQQQQQQNHPNGWPFNADATSFAATITWHKMEPKNGGSVFVSNFLNEGCGFGCVW